MPGPVFLEGDIVELRTVEESDLQFLQTHANDPQIWAATGIPAPANAQQEQEFFENVVAGGDEIHLLVVADGEPVGMVGLHQLNKERGNVEVGYWIAPDHHGNGYATEATELLVTYAFEHRRLHKVSAEVYEFNDASMRVLEKLGFVEEGILRDELFVYGEYQDSHRFSVLEEEWREHRT